MLYNKNQIIKDIILDPEQKEYILNNFCFLFSGLFLTQFIVTRSLKYHQPQQQITTS